MQNKKQAVEVQGGEIAIRNEHGDIAIIPREGVKKVELLVATGKHDLVDKYLNTLPKLSSYASDGTVIPKDKMINITAPDGTVKQVAQSSDEYKTLYNSGKLMNYDKATDTYIAPTLKEAEVTAEAPAWLKAKRKVQEIGENVNSALTEWGTYVAKENKDAGFFGTAMLPVTATLGAAQQVATKALTGKYQTPAEALKLKNPVAAFAADVVLDPLNLVGVGELAKLGKLEEGYQAIKSMGKGKAAKKVADEVLPEAAAKLESTALTIEDFNNAADNDTYRALRQSLLSDPTRLENATEGELNRILTSRAYSSYNNPNRFVNVPSNTALSREEIISRIEAENTRLANIAANYEFSTGKIPKVKKLWKDEVDPTIVQNQVFEEINKELAQNPIQADKNVSLFVKPNPTAGDDYHLQTFLKDKNGNEVELGYMSLFKGSAEYKPPKGAPIHPDFKPGETVEGVIKEMDFPTRAASQSVDKQGMGASYGQAVKKALKHFDKALISSKSHTIDGGARYLTGFLNDRSYVMDISDNTKWWENVQKLKAANPGKKWTTKEVVNRLTKDSYFYDMYHPQNIRFFYNNAGGGSIILGGGFVANYLKNQKQNDKTQ